MLTNEDKKLLAWALDAALTQRHKVGMLKYGAVMKAAENALKNPDIYNRVLDIVTILDIETADSIRAFMTARRK